MYACTCLGCDLAACCGCPRKVSWSAIRLVPYSSSANLAPHYYCDSARCGSADLLLLQSGPKHRSRSDAGWYAWRWQPVRVLRTAASVCIVAEYCLSCCSQIPERVFYSCQEILSCTYDISSIDDDAVLWYREIWVVQRPPGSDGAGASGLIIRKLILSFSRASFERGGCTGRMHGCTAHLRFSYTLYADTADDADADADAAGTSKSQQNADRQNNHTRTRHPPGALVGTFLPERPGAAGAYILYVSTTIRSHAARCGSGMV